MTVPEMFGENVFNLDVMREKLPKDVFRSLKKTIDEGKPLDSSIAGAVAHAMKEWAISKGATHYTHWFQPMTASPPKSTTVSSHPRRTARSSWSFRARNS